MRKHKNLALFSLQPAPGQRLNNRAAILLTMPHKFTAFAYCATSSERAKLLGVVSVMRRNPDSSWHGDMLDGLAFVKAQKDEGAQPHGARVLLVGAGGAGSAIAIALLDAGVRELVIHDTDESRTAHLIELLADLGRGRVTTGPPDPTAVGPVDTGLMGKALLRDAFRVRSSGVGGLAGGAGV